MYFERIRNEERRCGLGILRDDIQEWILFSLDHLCIQKITLLVTHLHICNKEIKHITYCFSSAIRPQCSFIILSSITIRLFTYMKEKHFEYTFLWMHLQINHLHFISTSMKYLQLSKSVTYIQSLIQLNIFYSLVMFILNVISFLNKK